MSKFKLARIAFLIAASMITLKSDSIFAVTRDIAIVLKMTGTARVKSGQSNWENLQKGHRLQDGDRVRTGAETLVALVFTDDKSMMKIRSNSEVVFSGERQEKGILKRLSLNVGQMWAKVNPSGAGFRIETPSGVAAVKGTEFYTLVDELGNTMVIGIKGLLELFNQLGSIMVGEGQTGRMSKTNAPTVETTESYDDWAQIGGDEKSLSIEFDSEDGTTKKDLKIRYRNK
jgi:hypothetical protein